MSNIYGKVSTSEDLGQKTKGKCLLAAKLYRFNDLFQRDIDFQIEM